MFGNLMRCLSGNAVGSRDMSLTVKGETHTGRVRGHNEDQYLALGGEQSPPGAGALLVVADGMGGHEAGEVASQTAVEGIEAFIEATVEMSSHQTWPVPFDPQQTVNRNRLRAAFCWGNRKIAKAVAASSELETSGKPSMGPTAVAVLIAGQAATVAGVRKELAHKYFVRRNGLPVLPAASGTRVASG